MEMHLISILDQGETFNQRDVIAVRKTVSGFIKLLYPTGKFEKEEVKEVLEKALAYRRRVKEQLKNRWNGIL